MKFCHQNGIGLSMKFCHWNGMETDQENMQDLSTKISVLPIKCVFAHEIGLEFDHENC